MIMLALIFTAVALCCAHAAYYGFFVRTDTLARIMAGFFAVNAPFWLWLALVTFQAVEAAT